MQFQVASQNLTASQMTVAGFAAEVLPLHVLDIAKTMLLFLNINHLRFVLVVSLLWFPCALFGNRKPEVLASPKQWYFCLLHMRCSATTATF
mmetsp:Transcript_56624/g.93151  ORF Transcript_56624/g.93151 Transcript_56624/m.93151 type:complete len:92 (+) Transcript_56624:2910-3185(+)